VISQVLDKFGGFRWETMPLCDGFVESEVTRELFKPNVWLMPTNKRLYKRVGWGQGGAGGIHVTYPVYLEQ
jgi:hypothetical protein